MASRSPVAMKTALARKLAGKARIEADYIQAIDHGNAGLLPDPVTKEIDRSRTMIRNRREYLLTQIATLQEQILKGDFQVIREINRLTEMLPTVVV